jgi:hypothetical protein
LRYRSMFLWMAVLAVLPAGCSNNKTASPASAIADASAQDHTDIEAVVQAYFGANTTQKVCATITRGLEEALGAHGGAGASLSPEEAHGPASPNCPSAIDRAVKAKEFDLVPVPATVGKVLVQLDRAAALVTAQNTVRPYFLFHLPSGWLIMNYGNPPRDFTELGRAIKDAQK